MGKANLNEVKLNQKNSSETTSNKKGLWDPKHFIIISLLFSFLPAGILYSLNYGRVGDKKKRNKSLLLSLLGFILFVVGIIFIPIIVPITMINLIVKFIGTGINIGVGVYLRNKQEKLFQEHIDNDGNKASFGVPVLLSFIMAVVIIFLPTPYDSIPDDKIIFNGDEVYYTDTVTVQESELVGRFLMETGYFVNDGNDVSVKLDKQNSIYILSFCINEEYIDDTEILTAFNELYELLTIEVFNGYKFEVHLCNQYFKTLKKVKLE